MMQFLKKGAISAKYTTPTGYDIIEDGDNSYLVMENLRGPRIWEVMDHGAQELSEKDANDTAEALQALRNDQSLRNILLIANSLTPLTHWLPKGPIFGYDNEGGRLIDDVEDFQKFTTVRFKEAEVDTRLVSVIPTVLAHGEPSPHNLKRCNDGGIDIMDLRTTFLAPSRWYYYAVRIVKEGLNYAEPLKMAMDRYGMGVGNKVLKELDNKFKPWFCCFGGAFGRSVAMFDLNLVHSY